MRLRRFLLALFCVALSACAITPTQKVALGGAKEMPPPELVVLADNVWLHKSYKDIMPWGPVLSQGLVIRTGESVLLVDTPWTDDDTVKLIKLVGRETGATAGDAIVTHAHDDKMGGVAALTAAGWRSHATALTNEDAAVRGLTLTGETLTEIGDDPGAAMNWRSDDIVIFYPGPGHTRDNIVVYHRPSRTLFGGCLIRPGGSKSLGNVADADIEGWAGAVERVSNKFPDAKIVIPSHGKPGGPDLLDHTITLAKEAAAASMDE